MGPFSWCFLSIIVRKGGCIVHDDFIINWGIVIELIFEVISKVLVRCRKNCRLFLICGSDRGHHVGVLKID
uniref:Putative secreted protein n=1 Tax=Anopheles marajoara TaxID=58244 RepID=A0A2M4CEJ4_9DIPT